MDLKENKINQALESVIKNISLSIDVNTVIGEPILGKNGEYIVPFSKVSYGILSGGGEFGKISFFNKNKELPYTTANGAIVTVKPCGFLIKNNENDGFKLLSVSETSTEKLLDKATDFLEHLSKNN